MAAAQPAFRLDHHAHRVGAVHLPRREPRIVGRDRAGTDHHGIEERAQPVRVQDVAPAADPVAGAAGGGDAPVQRLGEAAEHEAAAGPVSGGTQQRHEEVRERMVRRWRPAAGRAHQHRPGVVISHAPGYAAGRNGAPSRARHSPGGSRDCSARPPRIGGAGERGSGAGADAQEGHRAQRRAAAAGGVGDRLRMGQGGARDGLDHLGLQGDGAFQQAAVLV